MKLEHLDIENFRGVKGTYEFEPEGKNAVIVGPNGSGKSSILEAIDFLLRNDIAHLSGEGMGVVKESEVIPNVDADGDCIVRGVFRNEEEEQALVRDADSRQLDPPPRELPTALQRTIETANQGQHILTRSDLLNLVVTRPQSRREVLAELLDLPDIDERRLALKRTRRKLETRQDAAKASRSSVADRLRELVDSDATDQYELREDILTAINDLRDRFDADPVETIDPDEVRADIKSPVETVSTEALRREQPRDELEAFSAWIELAHEQVPELASRLRRKRAEFRDNETAEIDAKRLELLELGEKVIPHDADSCPLCRQKWAENTSLLEDVRRRRQQLEELKALRQEILDVRDELRGLLRDGRDHLDYLLKELEAETYPEVNALETFAENLEENTDALSKNPITAEEFRIGDLPILDEEDGELSVAIPETVDARDSLEDKAAKAADISETEQRYERLRTIAEQWAEYEKLDRRAEQLGSLKQDAERARSAFVEARKEVIGDIYEDIADRVQTYYNRIHPDESDAETSIKVTNTGAELNKEFFDGEEYPPQSVHSEGHLDTLGLCLHLALADYLQQDNKSLLLLDDVVMSVDQDHRLEIARMLADQFSEEYQIIITTHDELWAEQLKSQGALRGGEQVWLREWSLDDGLTESRRGIDVTEQWETVQEAMDDDEMQRAAHELRYATERMLQQACMSLEAKVEYDPRQRYTLGDFKDAVCRQLDSLTSEAKKNLSQHDEPEATVWARANELDDTYGEILDDVGQRLQKVNRRVHWTPGKWLTLSPEEFEEVFEAHREAYELLYCEECGSSLRYETFDDDYHELRCNCREHFDITWS